MHVDTVEYTFAIGQVGASEWEASANRTCIHIATDLQLVGHLWHGAIEALLLLAASNLAEDELLPKDSFNLVLNEIKFIKAVGV
ncbi:hypothetical protein D9M69_707880 [compost metagenome]